VHIDKRFPVLAKTNTHEIHLFNLTFMFLLQSDTKFVLYLEPGMPFLADSVDGGTTHSHEAFVHVANASFTYLFCVHIKKHSPICFASI
jgi:hypothetical protein